MYYLPKVHKHTIHPPGRPIVSGIDSITSRIGRYIDFYLKLKVSRMPSYLKDNKDVIRLLERVNVEDNYLLVTTDGASLYICIAYHLGFEAVKYFLSLSSPLAWPIYSWPSGRSLSSMSRQNLNWSFWAKYINCVLLLLEWQ